MDTYISEPVPPKVTTFCPKCRQESFIVTVENTGKGFNAEFEQTEYWFEGQGECTECGHSEHYADGSL
jgi:predicted nucleic-acid-binding Zn-ribbon protein